MLKGHAHLKLIVNDPDSDPILAFALTPLVPGQSQAQEKPLKTIPGGLENHQLTSKHQLSALY